MIKSVLVTGGAGYVGAMLVPALLLKGYKVRVLDWFLYKPKLFDDYKKNPNFIKIKGDLRSEKDLKKSLKGVDAVIHLACISNDPSFELDPNLGKSVNYDGTKLVIDMSVKSGVKRFIYASSSSVYGVKKEKRVVESLSLEPLTDYSKYKAVCENYLLSKSNSYFNVLIARPATVCGYSERLRLDLTVNMLTIQALVNKKITVFGGVQKRPNIHIKDMVRFYLKSLEWPDSRIKNKIYNVGYQNYSVSDIAKMVKKVVGDKLIEILYLPTNDLRSYHVSSQKIANDLNFLPKYTVENAIQDIKKAFIAGKIQDPFNNFDYWNVKKLKEKILSNE